MKFLSIKRWEKRRSKGFRHFVFVTGIFSFGLPLTLFGVAAEWWNPQHGGVFDRAPAFRSEFWRISLWFVLLGGPIVGMLWGFLTWKASEWLHRRSSNPDTGRAAGV